VGRLDTWHRLLILCPREVGDASELLRVHAGGVVMRLVEGVRGVVAEEVKRRVAGLHLIWKDLLMQGLARHQHGC